MFGLIKKIFIGILTSTVSASNVVKQSEMYDSSYSY